MVQVVMSFLDDTPDMETKLRVIETLRTVTEGKVSYFQFWGACDVG
jgi:26S proteasome regulatory subunit N5